MFSSENEIKKMRFNIGLNVQMQMNTDRI